MALPARTFYCREGQVPRDLPQNWRTSHSRHGSFHVIMVNDRKKRAGNRRRAYGRSNPKAWRFVPTLILLATAGCQLTDSTMISRSFLDKLSPLNRIVTAAIPATASFEEHAAVKESAAAKTDDEVEDDVKASASKPAQDPAFAAAAPESLDLTLEDALHYALENSKGIRVLSSVPQEMLTDVDIELARFDPAVFSGAQFGQNSQQAGSTVQALGSNLNTFQTTTLGSVGNSTDQLQLEKRWQSGTRAQIGYNTSYNFNNPAGQFLIVNPAYRSGLRLTVEQPILKGARYRINELGLRIARIRHDQSNQEFKADVNRILYEVEVAWWTLHRSRSNVGSLSRIVEYAEQAWLNERRQLELGLNSVADELQARENYEATRAQLAGAERDLTLSEQQLRQTLGMDPATTVKLVMHAVPFTSQFVPDLEQGMQRALAERPEIKAQGRQVQMTALELDQQKDGLLPDVNVLAGFGFSGLNNNFSGSVNDLAGANYPNWNLGLSFQQTLGQRAAKSSLRRMELAHTRAKLSESAQSDEVRYEVRASCDQVESTWQVLERQNARLQAAESRFQTHRRMYETGQLDIDRLMPSQEAYVMALRDQNAALVQYNMSINRWHYVTCQLTLDNVSEPVTPQADAPAGSDAKFPTPNAGGQGKASIMPAVLLTPP